MRNWAGLPKRSLTNSLETKLCKDNNRDSKGIRQYDVVADFRRHHWTKHLARAYALVSLIHTCDKICTVRRNPHLVDSRLEAIHKTGRDPLQSWSIFRG